MNLLPKWGKKSTTESVLPDSFWELVNQGGLGGASTLEGAVGLPAVLSIIRLLSHAMGQVDFHVVRERGKVVEEMRDSWQWKLLNRRPGPAPMTPFHLKADASANFAGRGEAYFRKIKPAQRRPDGPGVLELIVPSTALIKPRRSQGVLLYDDASLATGVPSTTADLIQARSFSTGGINLEDRGVSPITQARTMVSAGLRRQVFEDAHLKNGIFPRFALNYPEKVTEEKARGWIRFLREQQEGVDRAGQIAGIGGGATLTPLPISLADALFAEMTHITIEQAAFLWQVPLSLAMLTKHPPTDDDVRFLIAFALAPMANAMAEAFTADADMFGPGEDDLVVRPNFDRLQTIDPLVLAQVDHQRIQSGLRVADELRLRDGLKPYPPLADDWTQAPGQVPQITPVGGAPNPTVDTGVDQGDARTPGKRRGAQRTRTNPEGDTAE